MTTNRHRKKESHKIAQATRVTSFKLYYQSSENEKFKDCERKTSTSTIPTSDGDGLKHYCYDDYEGR